MSYLALTVSVALFLALLACLEAGFRLGRRAVQRDPESSHEGVGTVDAAIFALLGLLLGFSFAGATARLDARRELIVREANDIGTAYLRLDLLPSADQPQMRRLFRDYVDARLRMYQRLSDSAASELEMETANRLQQEIWTRAVAASRSDGTQNVARLLLPAINSMIDVTTARTIALHTHVPLLIFALVIGVGLLSGGLAGYAMAQRASRSWLHALVYALAVTLTVYAVLDLDSPRSGLIRLDAADAALVHLRESINLPQ